MHALLVGWLVFGVVGFWLARIAWGLNFGCAPVRVSTVVLMLLWTALPPLSIFAAIIWTMFWLGDGQIGDMAAKRPAFIEAWHKRRAARKIAKLNERIARRPRGPSAISRLWNAELFNPCRWFARHAEEDRIR